MSPPDDLLTPTDGYGRNVELYPKPSPFDPDADDTDYCFDVFTPDYMFLLTTTEQTQKMSTTDDEPGLNGRLRPRKSVATPQNTKTPKKSDLKISQEKPKKPTAQSKVTPKKQDDLANKSDLTPPPKSLCPYCETGCGSKEPPPLNAHRPHVTTSNTSASVQCIFCTHDDANLTLIRHMLDTHPDQHFACTDCHSRFQVTPQPSQLTERKLNVCKQLKDPYRNKLRKKQSNNKKAGKIDKKWQKEQELEPLEKKFSDGHGFNGIVISCEVKPCQADDSADIEDKITTNLIVPHSKSLAQGSGLVKGPVIVLDDIQWSKRLPPSFSFHNTDADPILSRLGVVHRSPRTGESTRRDWMKNIDNFPIKFEKCFETTFYSKVASNVQENLAKFLDGSFNFNPDPDNAIRTRKAKNSVAINTAEGFPILLACEQYSRSAFDGYMPRAIAPKHKWKWDNVDTEKTQLSADQIKRDSHTNNCIITLVSSLDIWTQLCMRRKFEGKFGTKPVEKKTEKLNIIGKELKEILESREIPSSSQVVKWSGAPEARTSREEVPLSLGLRRAVRAPAPPAPAVLSGEWVRPRCYVCCACGAQSSDARTLALHMSQRHPNAHVQHYEVVGEQLLHADILQHLYVPPRQAAGGRTRPPRGFRECTKCHKSVTLEELHQHMLECAGDTPAVRRRHSRHRPFGVRRRRPRPADNTARKKMRKHMRAGPRRQNKIIRSTSKIRSEVGDAETIRKMIADLPAKRHRVLVNPANKAARQFKMLNRTRNKMMMKKRHPENPNGVPRKRNAKVEADGPDPGGSGEVDNPPKEVAGQDDEDDEDNKPLKVKRLINQRTRKKDMTGNAPLRRHSIRVKQNNIKTKPEPNSTDTQELLDKSSPQGIDVKKGAYKTRERASRGQERSNNLRFQRNDGNRPVGNTRETANRNTANNNRDVQPPAGPSRPNRNNNDNNAQAPRQVTPLKHSIARLTANSETHDKAVQFHHCFLVQQECNNTNQDAPPDPRTLFESEAVASKLDKPPINYSDKSQCDLSVIQKNKSNKPKKGLNDCIAMLKNKLVDPVSAEPPGHVSVQCGSDDPISPIYLLPPRPISQEAMMVSPGSDYQSNNTTHYKGQVGQDEIVPNRTEGHPIDHNDHTNFAIPAEPRSDRRRRSTEQRKTTNQSSRQNTSWKQTAGLNPDITLERRRTTSTSSDKRSSYRQEAKALPRRKSLTMADLHQTEPTYHLDHGLMLPKSVEVIKVSPPSKPRTRSSNRSRRSSAQSDFEKSYMNSAQLSHVKPGTDVSTENLSPQTYVSKYSDRLRELRSIPSTHSLSYDQMIRQEVEKMSSMQNISRDQTIDTMPLMHAIAYDQAVHTHSYNDTFEKMSTIHPYSCERNVDERPSMHSLPYERAVEKIAQAQNIPYEHVVESMPAMHHVMSYNQRMESMQSTQSMHSDRRVSKTPTTRTISYDHTDKMPVMHDLPYDQLTKKMPSTSVLPYNQNVDNMNEMKNYSYDQTMMLSYPDSLMSTQSHEDMDLENESYKSRESDMDVYENTNVLTEIPRAHGTLDVPSIEPPNSPLDLSGKYAEGVPMDLSVRAHSDCSNDVYNLRAPSTSSMTESDLSILKPDHYQRQSTELSEISKERSDPSEKRLQAQKVTYPMRRESLSGHNNMSVVKENEIVNSTRTKTSEHSSKTKTTGPLQSVSPIECKAAPKDTGHIPSRHTKEEWVKHSEENNMSGNINTHSDSVDTSQKVEAVNTSVTSKLPANDSGVMLEQSLLKQVTTDQSNYEYERTSPAYSVANSVTKNNSNVTTTTVIRCSTNDNYDSVHTVASAAPSQIPERQVTTRNELNIEISDFGTISSFGRNANHDKTGLSENMTGTDTIDPETAKKIAMLPREIVEIIGTMPIGPRNQLLNVLPQYVATTMASPLSLPDTAESHSSNMVRNKTEDQTACKTPVIPQETHTEQSVIHPREAMVNDKISSTALTPSPPAPEVSQHVRDDKLPQPANLKTSVIAKLPDSEANESNQIMPAACGIVDSSVRTRELAKAKKSYNIKGVLKETEDMSCSIKMSPPEPTSLVAIDKSIRRKNYNEQTASLRAVRIRAQIDRQKESLPVVAEETCKVKEAPSEEASKLKIAEDTSANISLEAKAIPQKEIVSTKQTIQTDLSKATPVESRLDVNELCDEHLEPAVQDQDHVISAKAVPDLVLALDVSTITSKDKNISQKNYSNSNTTVTITGKLKEISNIESSSTIVSVNCNISNDCTPNAHESIVAEKIPPKNYNHDHLCDIKLLDSTENLVALEQADSEDDVSLAVIVKSMQSDSKIDSNKGTLKNNKKSKKVKPRKVKKTHVPTKKIDTTVCDKESGENEVTTETKKTSNPMESMISVPATSSNCSESVGLLSENVVLKNSKNKKLNSRVAFSSNLESLPSTSLDKTIINKRKGKGKKMKKNMKRVSKLTTRHIIEKNSNDAKLTQEPIIQQDHKISSDAEVTKSPRPSTVVSFTNSNDDKIEPNSLNGSTWNSENCKDSTVNKIDAVDTSVIPLRRSRRGKSLFNDSTEAETATLTTVECEADQKLPVTKKQLIFSKFLLDEENRSKCSAASIALSDDIKNDGVHEIHGLDNKQRATDDLHVEEKSSCHDDTAQVEKSNERKKITQRRTCKRKKKSVEPELAKASTSNDSPKTICSSEITNTSTNETVENDKSPDCDGKNEDPQPCAIVVKRKHSENSGNNSNAKMSKTSPQHKQVQGEYNDAENKIVPNTDSTPKVRSTTCYDMPKAARRTRSKSVIVKSSTTVQYDPYDIDLDDMNESEPVIKPFTSSHKTSQSKLKSVKTKNKSKKPSINIDDIREISVTPPVSNCCITDNFEDTESSSKNKNNVSAHDTVEQIEIKNGTTDDKQETETKKENLNDSDDSSKSDVPLKKYFEKKENNEVPDSAKDAENEPDSEVTKKGKKKKRGKPKKRRNNSEKLSPDNETKEQQRSEQFMESFGFFSERKPRRSNLIASKKIAETFHTANESDDVFLRRMSKKNNAGDNKSTGEASGPASSSKAGKRGRKQKKEPEPTPKLQSYYCTACKKIFARIDNLMRHQMTYIHAYKLSMFELRFKTRTIPDKPNYCIAFKEQMDKYRVLTASMKGKKKPKIKLPSLQDIVADAFKAVRQEELALRGLSTDEALFIDCCELLKESTAGAPTTAAGTPAAPKPKTCYGQCSRPMDLGGNLAAKASDGKSDGDVDSITARNILESEEVINLEKDLISSFKEAAARSKKSVHPTTSDIVAEDIRERIKAFTSRMFHESSQRNANETLETTTSHIDQVPNFDTMTDLSSTRCETVTSQNYLGYGFDVLGNIHQEKCETTTSKNYQGPSFDALANVNREKCETVTSQNYQGPSFDDFANTNRAKCETVTSQNYQGPSFDDFANTNRAKCETITSQKYQEPSFDDFAITNRAKCETITSQNYQGPSFDDFVNTNPAKCEMVTSQNYQGPIIDILEKESQGNIQTVSSPNLQGRDYTLRNVSRKRCETVTSQTYQGPDLDTLENVGRGNFENVTSENLPRPDYDVLRNVRRRRCETVTSQNYQETSFDTLANENSEKCKTVTSQNHQDTDADVNSETCEPVTDDSYKELNVGPIAKDDFVIPTSEIRGNKIRKSIELKETMYPDLEVDIFEDKFDKIKRKCRSQAAAAKQSTSVSATEPVHGHKHKTEERRKKERKMKKGKEAKKLKKIKKRAKKNQSTVLTKGALKGFDPTSDLDMLLMMSPTDTTKKKRNKSSKKKRDKRQSESSSKYDSDDRAKDSASYKKVDVYEFKDNEETELFELRPSTLMERFKSINFKPNASPTKREPEPNPGEESGSASDGDDFVYMSDNYGASDDETESSLLSDIGTIAKGKRKKTGKSTSPPKRKEVTEKTAVMGKIFKHNAVRGERKGVKSIESSKPQANLDKLFDSLLKDGAEEVESEKNDGDVVSSQCEESLSQSSSEPQAKRCLSPEVYNHPTPKKDIKPCLVVSAITKSGSIYGADCMPSTSKQADEMSLSMNDFNSSSQTDSEAFLPKKHDKTKKYDSDMDDEFSNHFMSFGKKPRKEKLSALDYPVARSPERDLARSMLDETGVATQRARRKCTVGKQNILAETWSSESEQEVSARGTSGGSVAPVGHRRKRMRKSGRRGNKQRADASRVTSGNRNTSKGGGDEGGDVSLERGSGGYEWGAGGEEGAEEQRRREQHGWIVGDSHKKLVTMLAHAKGRKCTDHDHSLLE